MCEACLQVTMLIQRNEECRPRCGIFGLYYLIYFNKGGQIYGYTHTHCKHKCFNETNLKKCNVAWHVFENWYQLLSYLLVLFSVNHSFHNARQAVELIQLPNSSDDIASKNSVSRSSLLRNVYDWQDHIWVV